MKKDLIIFILTFGMVLILGISCGVAIIVDKVQCHQCSKQVQTQDYEAHQLTHSVAYWRGEMYRVNRENIELVEIIEKLEIELGRKLLPIPMYRDTEEIQ